MIAGGEVEDYTVKIRNPGNGRPAITDVQLTPQNDWRIYPNPARDVLHVKVNHDESTHLLITDMTGKILLQQTFTSTKNIDLSGWSKGIYLVEISDGFTIIQEKIVVVD